jgi:hypothetical protein
MPLNDNAVLRYSRLVHISTEGESRSRAIRAIAESQLVYGVQVFAEKYACGLDDRILRHIHYARWYRGPAEALMRI